jgi:hypothetical protein
VQIAQKTQMQARNHPWLKLNPEQAVLSCSCFDEWAKVAWMSSPQRSIRVWIQTCSGIPTERVATLGFHWKTFEGQGAIIYDRNAQHPSLKPFCFFGDLGNLLLWDLEGIKNDFLSTMPVVYGQPDQGE